MVSKKIQTFPFLVEGELLTETENIEGDYSIKNLQNDAVN